MKFRRLLAVLLVWSLGLGLVQAGVQPVRMLRVVTAYADGEESCPATALASDMTGKSGRYSEDAWGQRRDPLDWLGTPAGTTDDGGPDSLTPRGFTGHEMLDGLGLVHMNGRIYDPLLGRFLSADVLVENPGNLQAYNRYSYVRNNPLTLTDPSGFASDDDGGANDWAAWLVSLFVPDTASLPGNTGSGSAARDGDEVAVREGARAGFEKGVEVVAAHATVVDTASSLIPGVQAGKDFGQLATGQDIIGRPASRADAGRNLAIGAALGVVAGKVSDLADKLVGKLASALSKETGTATRVEGAAVKTGLKDEVKDAPATVENAGRSGRQERLRELADDPDVSSADRGWIKNEQRHIETGNRDTIRNPPGKDLAHERGREAAKGYSYEHSNLQDRDLHRTQHKYDDKGRANKERPVKPKKKPDGTDEN